MELVSSSGRLLVLHYGAQARWAGYTYSVCAREGRTDCHPSEHLPGLSKSLHWQHIYKVTWFHTDWMIFWLTLLRNNYYYYYHHYYYIVVGYFFFNEVDEVGFMVSLFLVCIRLPGRIWSTLKASRVRQSPVWTIYFPFLDFFCRHYFLMHINGPFRNCTWVLLETLLSLWAT